ncbi:MAG TPA: hypothetical protein EYQ22_10470 [Gammaproteobacteria bacterium]|nr:hypothetical protein [Gammaproteobacteria bacterium]HIK71609.1 hypothetical protein [Pseudomonadales bacterium]
MARITFGLAIGILVAFFSYQWITDSSRRVERRLEESVVIEVRTILAETLLLNGLEIVDPLQPNREAGKVYIYRTAAGWQVSGYYRRQEKDPWHPFLMDLNSATTMTNLRVDDPEMVKRANADASLEVLF